MAMMLKKEDFIESKHNVAMGALHNVRLICFFLGCHNVRLKSVLDLWNVRPGDAVIETILIYIAALAVGKIKITQMAIEILSYYWIYNWSTAGYKDLYYVWFYRTVLVFGNLGTKIYELNHMYIIIYCFH
ncbi:hypothetical protein ACJX0J_025846, partial [Zea mays]